MRKLLICTLLLAVGETAIPIPAQTTVHAANSATGDKPQSVAISELPSVSVSKDWADWGYWGFGGLLVVVGFLQVWLIKRQANLMKRQVDDAKTATDTASQIAADSLEAIKRQADLMADQAILMEVPYRQWLELRDWDAGIPLAANGEGRKFGIRVQLVNTTAYPITLNSGEILFSEAPYGRTTWSVGDDRFIAPGRQLGIETYLMITFEQQVQYRAGSISVPLSGRFTFTGILGKTTTQRFSGRIRRGEHVQVEFTPEIDMNPTNGNIDVNDTDTEGPN